jgi:hypothetical protein
MLPFIALGALTVATQNQVFMYPMAIFVFLSLPLAATALSVGLAMFIISLILRFGTKVRSSLSVNPEYANPFPSTKKMIFWTTVNTVGFMASLVSGGGWLPADILHLDSIGIIFPLYMPAIMIASAFNAAMWLLQWKGITFKQKGFGEFSLGRYMFSLVSISIGLVGIGRLIINSVVNGDPNGMVPLMITFAIFASVSAAFSFFLTRRTLLPRIMRQFQIKIDRLVA